jgi:DNA-binding CsgD family transcriptional regulator
MPGPVARGIDTVIRSCYAPSDDWPQMRDRLLAGLRKVVPVDAAFVATTDPETLLYSSAWADEELRPYGRAFLDSELSPAPDVNRFTDLAQSARAVMTLDEATGGEWASSTRWRTIMAPIGLGDELRVVLRTGTSTLAFLCLHREGSSPFTRAEVSAVEQIAPHAAEAARRTTAAVTSSAAEDAVLVEQAGIVIACSGSAAELLEALEGRPVAIGDEVPLLLLAVVRRLEAIEHDPTAADRPAAAIIRTLSGSLVEVQATRLLDASGAAGVVLTLRPPSGPSRAALRLAAIGLTPAQCRVATLVLQGRSTREIMADLKISQHTVQDHMKAIFDRSGVRSRRELVVSLMGG